MGEVRAITSLSREELIKYVEKCLVEIDIQRVEIQQLRTANDPVPEIVFLGCARMGMAGASDEEVLNYARRWRGE